LGVNFGKIEKMKKALFILIGLSLILPVIVSANEVIRIENPLETEDFEVIIGKIIDFIFKIAIPIVPLMMIYAGFLFVTAGGSTQKIEQAKNIIIWTIVGLAIVLLARGFLAIIEQLLGVRGA